MLRVTETEKGVIFVLRVVPRASRSEIAGIQDESLKIRITAPPVEGRANEACITLLSDFLQVPRSRIAILGGSKTKNKRVFVGGITRHHIEVRLRDHAC